MGATAREEAGAVAGSIPAQSAAQIVVVGGGLAGTLAAVVLARAGHDVALIDLHALYPPDFRAEQLVGGQIDLLRGLGVLEGLVGSVAPAGCAVDARFGRVVGREESAHYGLRYEAMVKAARAMLPPSVRFLIGRVTDVRAEAGRQVVALASGEIVRTRLVVMATGPGRALSRKLGIGRRIIREHHSLAVGFDIEPGPGRSYDCPVLVYHGERVRDRIDYLSVFPLGEGMRANLFAYWLLRDERTEAMRKLPAETLAAALPGLRAFLGEFRAIGSVQVRTNHLHAAEDYRRDGIVLIGDAFRMSCPAAGTGVDRLLTDIDRLCNVHVPEWLASPGMDAAKIGRFYDDPVKRVCDAEAAHRAEYRRAAATEATLPWRLHRLHVQLRRRMRARLTAASSRLSPPAPPPSAPLLRS
jgi:2-polyprenyl-6-methoxyphenol hydroxylase-like FAD-dependent oxidoreductase